MPSGSPPDAKGEIATIRRILGEASINADAIDRLDVLLDLIESGNCGILHFACHNTFAVSASGSAIAMDGGPFVPMLLNKAIMRHTLAERHPLVFINACRSVGAVPEYTRMMGWAEGFMAAGAGAFAGTLWAVRSQSAAAFAETFYAALTAGSPLGEACRQARVEAGRDRDDPTWLADWLAVRRPGS
jgi:CHAT domain-containing protein